MNENITVGNEFVASDELLRSLSIVLKRHFPSPSDRSDLAMGDQAPRRIWRRHLQILGDQVTAPETAPDRGRQDRARRREQSGHFNRYFPDSIRIGEHIVGEPDHRWKKIYSAPTRQPRIDVLVVVGSPFGQICRHPDTPLLSFPPCRRFPRPTPERSFGVNHQSRPRFSGTRFLTRRPRPIGT